MRLYVNNRHRDHYATLDELFDGDWEYAEQLGLVEIADECPHGHPGYLLTDKGWRRTHAVLMDWQLQPMV